MLELVRSRRVALSSRALGGDGVNGGRGGMVVGEGGGEVCYHYDDSLSFVYGNNHSSNYYE